MSGMWSVGFPAPSRGAVLGTRLKDSINVEFYEPQSMLRIFGAISGPIRGDTVVAVGLIPDAAGDCSGNVRYVRAGK